MNDIKEKIQETVDYIKGKIGGKPQIGIILGSGLGSLVDVLEQPVEIDYKDIPGFPEATAPGHAGKLIYGLLGGKRVLAMKGRFHYYEGYDISQVVFHIRVFKLLGIDDLLVTNAAGGVNTGFKPGDLMLITDHISFFAPSPLRGRNLDEFGTRFPDMCGVYSSDLIETAKKAAGKEGLILKEGIYAFAQGPMYETPAEIRAFRVLGADAVGMSTVPEVITAHHSGMKVLGISCITNMAAGILNQPLNHKEVLDIGKQVEKKFSSLVTEIISNWPI
ncbi:MAG: purine-nucleoside phosphorylase [Clostridiaceae bacterium]